MGTRYFYYMILQNMVLNVIVLVPHILISHRFDGAITSMLVAMVIGVALTAICTRALSKTPDQSVPDLLLATLPKWVAKPMILYLSTFWFSAGCLTLLSFAEVTERYTMPDTPTWAVLMLFLTFIVYTARKKTRTLLRGLELLFIINIPLVGILMAKAIFSKEFNWWAVQDVFTHSLTMPNLETISAATFVFSGYTTLMIINPVIKTNINNWKHYLFIAMCGLVTLVTTTLIPIGFHGTTAVAHYVYPWVVTSDSMRLEYFIIERVLYIFLLLYLSIILVSALFQWHIGAELVHTIFRYKWAKDIMIGLFVVVLFLLSKQLDDQFSLGQFALYWLTVRFISEFGYVALVVYSVRRFKRQT